MTTNNGDRTFTQKYYTQEDRVGALQACSQLNAKPKKATKIPLATVRYWGENAVKAMNVSDAVGKSVLALISSNASLTVKQLLPEVCARLGAYEADVIAALAVLPGYLPKMNGKKASTHKGRAPHKRAPSDSPLHAMRFSKETQEQADEKARIEAAKTKYAAETQHTFSEPVRMSDTLEESMAHAKAMANAVDAMNEYEAEKARLERRDRKLAALRALEETRLAILALEMES